MADEFQRRYPFLDREMLLDVAECVTRGRYTIKQAKAALRSMADEIAVQRALAAADQLERMQPAPSPMPGATPSSAPTTTTTAPLPPKKTVASAMVKSATSKELEEVTHAGFAEDELLLYLTSLTSLQQVRDHTRQMRNLLHMLRLKYTELDISDESKIAPLGCVCRRLSLSSRRCSGRRRGTLRLSMKHADGGRPVARLTLPGRWTAAMSRP